LKDAFGAVDAVTDEGLLNNTKRWLHRSVVFGDDEPVSLAWLRLIFEGRGMADSLQNMLGKPPLD
jgi:hypothetical protein